MRTQTTYCEVDGCDREAARGGLCWGHVKRKMRGQALVPLTERPKTPVERLTEAAIAYAEAEGDVEYERAYDTLRKAAAAAGTSVWADLVREGIDDARAKGGRHGRPRKADPREVAEAMQAMGHREKVQAFFKISRATLFRLLKEQSQKPPL